ncbi:MAG: InlB B-repeat-containing protein [bacterium]|nr:InlB B-repeat-containing protein [bacterium]
MKKINLIIIIFVLVLTGCKSKTYTVTINLADGTQLASLNIPTGSNLKDVDIPEKDGYIFVSLLKNGLEYDIDTPVKEDMTLTATYVEIPNIAKKYTVSFDFGNNVIKTQTIRENEKVNEPKAINKNKYKFLGWYLDGELYDFDLPVTKDIKLVAKYEKMVVTIKFVLNGGSGIVSKEYTKGEIPSVVKEPSRLGYRFTYWTLEGNKYLFDKEINEDLTLEANWEVISYVTVLFDTDGGNELKAITIESGSKIDAPLAVKEGYEFMYWEYEGKEFNFDTKIDKNITLIARYRVN